MFRWRLKRRPVLRKSRRHVAGRDLPLLHKVAVDEQCVVLLVNRSGKSLFLSQTEISSFFGDTWYASIPRWFARPLETVEATVICRRPDADPAHFWCCFYERRHKADQVRLKKQLSF